MTKGSEFSMGFFTKPRKVPRWVVIGLLAGSFLSLLATEGYFEVAYAGLFVVNVFFTFTFCARDFAELRDTLRQGTWSSVGWALRWSTHPPLWLLVALALGALGAAIGALLAIALILCVLSYAHRERAWG